MQVSQREEPAEEGMACDDLPSVHELVQRFKLFTGGQGCTLDVRVLLRDSAYQLLLSDCYLARYPARLLTRSRLS